VFTVCAMRLWDVQQRARLDFGSGRKRRGPRRRFPPILLIPSRSPFRGRLWPVLVVRTVGRLSTERKLGMERKLGKQISLKVLARKGRNRQIWIISSNILRPDPAGLSVPSVLTTVYACGDTFFPKRESPARSPGQAVYPTYTLCVTCIVYTQP
jgi:hypothetical protein